MSWLRPQVLETELLRLEPLAKHHLPGLAQSADKETFKYYTSYPETFDESGFEKWCEMRTQDPKLTYVMIRNSDAQVVGCSCMFDASESNRKLEIGYTWIVPECRKAFVNPTAKYLMLRHCFETLDCLRVQLKTDDRNEQSKAAILKLGAKFEGVLRKSFVMPDGHVRDTAYFSIVGHEWPEIKANLEARLELL